MKKQNDDSPHQPHTKFFEAVFSNMTVAKDLIEQFLPPKLVSKLHTNQLRIEKGSYLTKELQRLYSDVVYECPYGKGKKKIKLQFLMEHKSIPEPFPYAQFLSYETRIWNKQKEEKKPLTPIIPILFYHGEKKWKHRKFEEMFDGIDDEIRPFLPSFEYYLIDLANFSDQEILNLRFSFLINTLLTFKHYRDKNYIFENIELVFSLTLKKHEWNLYDIQFRYITWNNEFSEAEQKEIVHKVQEPIKNTIMSTYEALIQKGLQQGEDKKTKEHVLKMHALGISLETIIQITSLSKAEVKKIIAKKHS